VFSIGAHTKDLALLESVKAFFGGIGSVTKLGVDSFQYRVSSVKELLVIISHFDKYPLITQKWSDYQLFKQAVELVKSKDHLTIEGLHKIISIRASIKKGWSGEWKTKVI